VKDIPYNIVMALNNVMEVFKAEIITKNSMFGSGGGEGRGLQALRHLKYSGVTPKLSPCAIPRTVPTLLPTLTPSRALGNCYLYMKF